MAILDQKKKIICLWNQELHLLFTYNFVRELRRNYKLISLFLPQFMAFHCLQGQVQIPHALHDLEEPMKLGLCLCNSRSYHFPFHPRWTSATLWKQPRSQTTPLPPLAWNLETQNPRWRQATIPRKIQPSQQKHVLRMRREGNEDASEHQTQLCSSLLARSVPTSAYLQLLFKTTFAAFQKEKWLFLRLALLSGKNS